MKKSELRQLIKEEISGGKNPEADKKVKSLINNFSKSLDISNVESANLIKSSLKRLGY